MILEKFEPHKSSFSREELLACGRGELFQGGMPRLPTPPMLMIDRFTKVTAEGGKYGRGFIEGELDIKPDLWFFDCHFIGDPVMPGCLGLDALWQMLGFYLGWLGHRGRGRALGCESVRFVDQVLSDTDRIQYRLDIKRVIDRKLILGIADGQVLNKGKVIYECDGLKTGLFN